jgi:hypothetical protein
MHQDMFAQFLVFNLLRENIMKKITLFLSVLICGYLSIAPSFADGFETDPSWALGINLGGTYYANGYGHDGQSAIGRLSIEKLLLTSETLNFGIELGIQNGNTMRLDIPQETLDVLGGEPVSIIVKPTIDLLLTARSQLTPDCPVFVFAKGGMAYRVAQLDRREVNDLTKYSPEVQAGMGYQMNDYLSLNLSYQSIFGGNPRFALNETNELANISNIPNQQSVMIGLSLYF